MKTLKTQGYEVIHKLEYRMQFYKYFNYNILYNIKSYKKNGRGDNKSYNDIIVGADTETSKLHPNIINNGKPEKVKNYVVAWTISLRSYDKNIVTLWGRRPSELVECLKKIRNILSGYYIYIYIHNLAYDWVFLRKFLIKEFGNPTKQLNTNPHYPISIQFECGIVLKDSLILAQRSLEKWALDMNVEHQKAVGLWEYDKIRSQDEYFSTDNLKYIENDTLSLVECIQVLMNQLKKNISTMPYTATGIPREDVRKIGKDFQAKKHFNDMVPDYKVYRILEMVFHGGFTHANRHIIEVILQNIVCRDEASAYPFVMITEKFPMERFTCLANKSIDYILRNSSEYAFIFKLILNKPELKNYFNPMPALQFSKCVKCINPIVDNGRILSAEYVEIYLNEVDLSVIAEQYDFEGHICTDVYAAHKDYLPRWFTDYIFKCFYDKTMLKGGDPVLYALAKAKLNSLYGMCVQKNIKETLIEDYETGEYIIEENSDPEEIYNTYIKKRGTILPYQWGVWVTSYAFRNIFDIGACVADDGIWAYTDTDSVYSDKWDEIKIQAYNDRCKKKLLDNGYGPVVNNGREYWLGICEIDGVYEEFKTLGAKRYVTRADGKLKITVAGVPKKKGGLCLNDDIGNFKKGFIFDGVTTGKLMHTYIFTDEIEYINGIEVGDSIDLTPCDYELDSIELFQMHWDVEETNIQIYEDIDERSFI